MAAPTAADRERAKKILGRSMIRDSAASDMYVERIAEGLKNERNRLLIATGVRFALKRVVAYFDEHCDHSEESDDAREALRALEEAIA